MEDKITETLKKILSNPDLVEETFRASDEYYFIFKGVAMSVYKALNRESKYGNYSFFIYPKWTGPLSDLAHESSLGNLDEKDMDMIICHMGQYDKNSEASGLFEPLFNLIQKKHTKIDLEDVFRKILE